MWYKRHGLCKSIKKEEKNMDTRRSKKRKKVWTHEGPIIYMKKQKAQKIK
jgi:hypothetical protein